MTCPRPHSEPAVELGMEHRSSVPFLEPLDPAPLYLYTFFTHIQHMCTPAHPTPLGLYVQQTAVGDRGRGGLRSVLTEEILVILKRESKKAQSWITTQALCKPSGPSQPRLPLLSSCPPGWLVAANSLGGGGT